MVLILPLLSIPLGIVGVIIAFIVGIVGDQILLMIIASVSVRRIVTSNKCEAKLSVWPIDSLTIAETGLLVLASETCSRGLRDFPLYREWLTNHAKHWRVFFPQHSRMCYELYSLRDRLDPGTLIEWVFRGDQTHRHIALLTVATTAVSSSEMGIEASGLDFLHRLGVGLNIESAEFSQIVYANYRLNYLALTMFHSVLGNRNQRIQRAELQDAYRHLVKDQVAESVLVQSARMAYTALEDQLDLIDRAMESYRKTVVRETTKLSV